MLIPELQEFHRLFAQMDILKEKLIKFWSRNNHICDNVSGSGSPTPPGVGGQNSDSTVQAIGKMKKQQEANSTTHHFSKKIKGLKKSKDSRWTV